MSILDRILLVLLTLGSLCAAVIVFLLGLGVLGAWTATAVDAATTYPYYTIVIAIVFALLALRFLFYRWTRSADDYVVLPGEHGFIRISFETVRQLANRTGKSVRGVQEFDTRVRNGQAGILLAVRVHVLPDIELTEMSKQIQMTLKSYLEQMTGVAVDRITVNIVELAAHSGAKTSKAWVE